MKKIVVALFLFQGLYSIAQTDTTGTELLTPPDSTAIGTADGKPVNKEIGAAGGTIISEDGKVELIFPQGALAETKTISIQPTSNNAPNGSGKAYWFEPSGTRFNKPVQIIFHYTDEEAESCPPYLMYLALQDKSGKWSFSDYEETDTISKTLKGFIHHFSGGANGSKLKMETDKKQLRVKETAKLRIWRYSNNYDVLIEPTFPTGVPVVWYVNRIEMGDDAVGRIGSYEENLRDYHVTIHRAQYFAPNFIVKKNPVTISVDIYVYSGKKKVYDRSTTLSCKIIVYDVYTVTVIHQLEFRAAMGNEVTDSASFFVWVYPDKIILNTFKNYPPFLTRSARRGPCSLIIFTSGADGSIHLTDGYRDFKISNDNPPEVLFRFLSTVEKTILRFSWVCPGMPPTAETDLRTIPVAPEINFIANGRPQQINVNDNGTKYKLKVVPYRP